MSKVLLITNRADITTDFIVKELQQQNIDFYRFNTETLGDSVSLTFDLQQDCYLLHDNLNKKSVDLKQVTAVYYRRPELPKIPEGLTTGQRNLIRGELINTLEGLYRILIDANWISNVFAIRQAENKVYQLLIAKSLNFVIPATMLTNIPGDAMDFFTNNKSECIIKPIKCGLVEGLVEEGVVFTSKINLTEDNIERITSSPVYLQRLVRKKGDVRVTVVGKKIFAAFIDSQGDSEAEIDWRKSDHVLPYQKLELPEDIAEKCLLLLQRLDLKFGAIDFILDEFENYIFLEINPNGQWAWIEKQLGYEISKEIVSTLVEKGALRNKGVLLAAAGQ